MKPGKIRVVELVAGIAIGDQIGGAERIGIELACALDRTVFDPVVFAMWGYGSPAEEKWRAILDQNGIPVYGLTPDEGLRLPQLAAIFKNLWRATMEFRPHIIHSHSQRGDVPNLLMHLLHPVHPLAVRTNHIDQPWLNRAAMDITFNRLVFPWAFNREIAVSETIRRKLDQRRLARALHNKALLCHESIDDRLLQPVRPTTEPPPLPTGAPESGPRIGIVGRLAPQKGHQYLLDALPQILRVQPVHLLIIGSGPLEAQLKAQTARLGITEHVHFLGSRTDAPELMRSLDLLVSSSLWEGLQITVLEAMALGVPVVVTDVSGAREVIQSGVNGWVAPPANPAALGAAIIEMLQDPARARLMAELARHTVTQFTLERSVAFHAELYRELTFSHSAR